MDNSKSINPVRNVTSALFLSRGQQLCLGVFVGCRVDSGLLLFRVVSRGFRQAVKGPLRSSKANSGLILSTLHSISARLNLFLLLCLYE